MKDKFIGEWTLISMTNEKSDGTITYPNSQNVKGLLSYSEKNTMSAQLGSLDRNKFVSNDFRFGTNEEIITAFNGYISYFGTYEINEEKQYIIHHIEMSLFPNWIGTKVKRFFEFIDDSLILRATAISENGISVIPTLTWKRRN